MTHSHLRQVGDRPASALVRLGGLLVLDQLVNLFAGFRIDAGLVIFDARSRRSRDLASKNDVPGIGGVGRPLGLAKLGFFLKKKFYH